MRQILALVAAVVVLGASIAASPAIDQQGAAAALAARKGNYREIGGAFKAINDELRSGAPDMNAVRPAARDLAQRAQLTLGQFPRGSGPGPGVITRAKADIWSNQPIFVKLQSDMIAAAKALDAAAARGDVAAIKGARDLLGATCKSCHERFRDPS